MYFDVVVVLEDSLEKASHLYKLIDFDVLFQSSVRDLPKFVVLAPRRFDGRGFEALLQRLQGQALPALRRLRWRSRALPSRCMGQRPRNAWVGSQTLDKTNVLHEVLRDCPKVSRTTALEGDLLLALWRDSRPSRSQ